ncbi:MAG: ATP-dependent helicase, partial [Burkholderiales bacterium]
MTDTFEVQGDFSPAQTIDSLPLQSSDSIAVPAAPVLPNGFVKLGLAPELVRAVEDLGFTQPTTVQEQT